MTDPLMSGAVAFGDYSRRPQRIQSSQATLSRNLVAIYTHSALMHPIAEPYSRVTVALSMRRVRACPFARPLSPCFLLPVFLPARYPALPAPGQLVYPVLMLRFKVECPADHSVSI